MKKNYLTYLLLLVSITIQAQVPANDDCAHATVIATTNYTNNQDATNATNNSGGLDVCGSPAWGMNDGVWYKLTGTGGDVNISVTPNGWNCQVDVYSGSCGSFNCVLGLNDGNSNNGQQEQGMFFADDGADFYINIGHWAYDASDPQADSPEGPFSISVNGAILSAQTPQIENLKIFLNTEMQLQVTTDKNIQSIVVYDLLGNEVINKNPNQQKISLDFTSFKSGLYIVKIIAEHKVGVYKIIRR